MLNTNYKIKIEGKKRNIYYNNKNKKYYVKINSEKYDVSKLFQKNKKKITGGILTNTILQDECKITNNVVKFLNQYPVINEIFHYFKKKNTNFETRDIQEIIVFLNSRNIIFNLNKTDIGKNITSEIKLVFSFLCIFHDTINKEEILFDKKFDSYSDKFDHSVNDNLIKMIENEHFFYEKLEPWKNSNNVQSIDLNLILKKTYGSEITWKELYIDISTYIYTNSIDTDDIYYKYIIKNFLIIKHKLFNEFVINFLFDMNNYDDLYTKINTILNNNAYYKLFNIIPDNSSEVNIEKKINEFILLFLFTLLKTLKDYNFIKSLNVPVSTISEKENQLENELENELENIKKKIQTGDNIDELIKTVTNKIISIFNNEIKNEKIKINFDLNNSTDLLFYKIYNNEVDLFIYFFNKFIYYFDTEIINYYNNVRVFICINPYKDSKLNQKHNFSENTDTDKFKFVIDKIFNKINYTYSIPNNEVSTTNNHTSYREIIYNKQQDKDFNFKTEIKNKIIKIDMIKMQKDNHKYIYCASGYSGSGKTYCLDLLLKNILSGITLQNFKQNVKFKIFELYGEINSKNELDIKIYNWNSVNGAPKCNEIFFNNDNTELILSEITLDNSEKIINFLEELNNQRLLNNNVNKYNARIRSTPNNENSSRSHLIINFNIHQEGDNNISFKILDMAGSEDIQNIQNQYYLYYNGSKYQKDIDNITPKLRNPLLKINSDPLCFYEYFLNEFKTKIENNFIKESSLDNLIKNENKEIERFMKLYSEWSHLSKNDLLKNYLVINDKKDELNESDFYFLKDKIWLELFENPYVKEDIKKNKKDRTMFDKLDKIKNSDVLKYLVNWKTPFMYILYKVLKIIDTDSFKIKLSDSSRRHQSKEIELKKIDLDMIKLKYIFCTINRLLYETFGYVFDILNSDKSSIINFNSSNDIINLRKAENMQGNKVFHYNRFMYGLYERTESATQHKFSGNFIIYSTYELNSKERNKVDIGTGDISYYKLLSKYHSQNKKRTKIFSLTTKNITPEDVFKSLFTEKTGMELIKLFEIIDRDDNVKDKINFNNFKNFTDELKKYYIEPLKRQGEFIKESIDIFQNICRYKNLNNTKDINEYCCRNENENINLIKKSILFSLNIGQNNNYIKNISNLDTKMVILCCIKYFSLNYQDDILNEDYTRTKNLYIQPIDDTLKFAEKLTKIPDTKGNLGGGKKKKRGGLMDDKFSIFQEKFIYELIIIFYNFISLNGSIDNDKLMKCIKTYHKIYNNETENINIDDLFPTKISQRCLKKQILNEDKPTIIIFYGVSIMAIMNINCRYIENLINKYNEDQYSSVTNKYIELLKMYVQEYNKEKKITDFEIFYLNLKIFANNYHLDINESTSNSLDSQNFKSVEDLIVRSEEQDIVLNEEQNIALDEEQDIALNEVIKREKLSQNNNTMIEGLLNVYNNIHDGDTKHKSIQRKQKLHNYTENPFKKIEKDNLRPQKKNNNILRLFERFRGSSSKL